MANDIWSTLSKKKSSNINTLTIPAKKTNNSNNTTPTAETQKQVQAKPVKAPKVKPHKVQQHKAQPQQTQPQLNDFRLATSGDSAGVHITTLYQNQPVHQFSLLRGDYAIWQRLQPIQKIEFVRARTNINALGGDATIFNAVVNATVQILNTLFAQAQQAHKRSMF